jgi:hypothetical protein
LAGSKTDDTTKFVLENLEKEDFAELGRILAKGILAASDIDGVSQVFSDIKFEMDSAGVADAEEIMRMKIQSSVDKFVG